MKTIRITSILIILISSYTLHAQQAEIEHNSSNTNPHLLLKETDNSDWVRLWFTNNNTSNKWAINAKTLPGSMDNQNKLAVPIIFAYEGQQILGLSENGDLRINKAYTLPNYDGAANTVLQTDGMGNVSWQNVPGTGGVYLEKIEDNDQDTYITSEAISDDDKIRMYFGENTANTSIERITLGYNDYETFRIETKDTRQNLFIGNDAGLHNGLNSSLTYHARSNIGLGYRALYKNEIGDDNIAIGSYSLEMNTIGKSNVAIGPFSLWNLTDGNDNVSIGQFSGAYNIGSSSENTYIGSGAGSMILSTSTVKEQNVAIGSRAGSSAEGNQNVYIGVNAGLSADGDRNVLIGHNAGYNLYENDILIIENGNANALLPLIYGEFDNSQNRPKLEVNGVMKVSDVLELKVQSTAPVCDTEGQIYLLKDSGATPVYKLQVCNGSTWEDF